MANYTFAQLEGLWISAGGNAAVAPIMAAIALAESSGNPDAINATDNGGTQTSWGLWQISDGTHNMPVANILNPQINAQQAVAKYTAGGFSPWGTYTSGAYKRYLPAGAVTPAAVNPQAAPQTAQTDSALSILTDPFHLIYGIGSSIAGLVTNPASIATSVTSIAQDVSALSKTLNTMLSDALWLFKPSNWVRIGAFVFGVGALLPGIWMLSKAGRGEGDLSLALGVLLVVIAGCLLFVAFHSLPENITSLSNLLGYISSEIRSNSPASTTPIADQGLAQATQSGGRFLPP